ncbi:MAG: serine--tRNA ligase [Zetaproteobacteria bacterium]|nr:MAG: serine--tRNA ligase [Zetaproteobacteria bacterium]
MFDIRAIRNEPEKFDKGWKRRGLEAQTPAILKLDADRRSIQTSLQELQAKRNDESKKIGLIKRDGGDAQEQMDAVAAIKSQMGEVEEQERALNGDLKDLLSALPNLMADDVPDGTDEDDNVEIHKWGEIKSLKGPDHVEIGEALGLIDFETAANISGARFTILKGEMARMERALAQFFLDTHTAEHGLTEVSPPLLVREDALYGTGQLPKFGEDLFKTGSMNWDDFKRKIEGYNEEHESSGTVLGSLGELEEILKKRDAHYLIPTSEVPLTNMVADQIVDTQTLPLRYCAHTPCFRSEAGSAGKDTKGMLRQHQFYKVEMVSITTADKSEAEQERMLNCAETVLKKLELPFRTVTLCSGDTGFGATKTYDIEVWLPGQETYREVSSISNCKDFQARRMNARTRVKGEKDTHFVHTLNGSGVAVGRALIAVIENYYDPTDGGVFVPEVLKPYMGGIEKIVKG